MKADELLPGGNGYIGERWIGQFHNLSIGDDDMSLSTIRTEKLEDKLQREHDALLEKVGAERLRIARMTDRWEEIPDDLVRRPLGLLVSASSDRVYRPVPGLVFAPRSASLVDTIGQFCFVVRDGEPVFFKSLPETWSEMVAKREGRL